MTRSRLIRLASIAALALVLGVLALAVGLYWLTSTESGVRRLLALAAHVPGIAISAQGVSGTPASGLGVEHLHLDHERVSIDVDQLTARLNPAPLLAGTIYVTELGAARVAVRVKPPARPPDHVPPTFLPAFLRVVVGRATVGEATVSDATGELFAARALKAAADVTRSHIKLTGLAADAGSYRLGGEATLTAADPLGLSGAVDVVLPLEGDVLDIHATLSGDVEHLGLDATLKRPAATRFAGVIDLSQTAVLNGELSLATSDLAPLVKDQPLGRIEAKLSISGNLGGFTLSGPLRLGALPVGALKLYAEGRYADATLSLKRAELATAGDGPRLEASGQIKTQPRTSLDLGIRWQRLRYPFSGRPVAQSSAGSVRLQGAQPFAFALDGDLGGPRLPPMTLRAQGSLDPAHVEVASLTARLLDGEIRGKASADLAGARAWSVALRGDNLNPVALRPRLNGSLHFAAQAMGRGFEPSGDWQATLTQLSGRIQAKSVSGGGTATMRAGQIALSGAHLKLASLQASVDGQYGAHTDLTLNARLDNLGDFVAGGAGTLHAAGRYAHDGAAESLKGSAEAAHLKLGSSHVEALSASADLDSTGRATSRLSVTGRGIVAGGVPLDTLTLNASGPAQAHEVNWHSQSGNRHADFAGHGAYVDGEETLAVESLILDAPKLARFTLEARSELKASRQHAQLAQTCLVADATRLCAVGNWQADGTWNGNVTAHDLKLDLLPLPLPAGTEYAGSLSLSAAAHGRPGADVLGEAHAVLDGAEFRYRVASGRVAAVKLGTGRIDASANPDTYSLTADLRTTADSYLSLDASAERSAATSLADSPLHGQLRTRTRELDAIPILVRDLDRVTGLLEAEIGLGGTVGAPTFNGRLTFTEGEADIYLSNLRLRDIAATVDLHGNALDLDASAHAGAGQMAAKGNLDWVGGQLQGLLRFNGENLLVAALPEARIVASPDVTLKLAGNTIEVRGTVVVPSANIAPKDLSAAVRPSSDQVIVGARGGAGDSQLLLDSQIKVTVGPDVRIAAYGLKGLLQGSILVTAKTDGPVTGSGELEIKDGHYLAYARELDIERGRLVFRGGPVDDAVMDVRASRKLPGYTAGVNVRGTLQNPQLSFFSDPALPQSQIASLLIVGQTTGGGSGADAGSLLAAQGGAMLVGDYTHYLGIDQLTIEADSNNGTALVLGKFLSPRLYVSYGISLAQAINTLKLRYTIGDNWVLNTESGLNHSADLQYSFQR